MKTVLLSIFALALAHLSYAQVNKGAFLIGTDFSFSHSNYNLNASSDLTEESTSNSFSLSPNVGYFTSNSFMVGLGISYSFQGNENEFSTSVSESSTKRTTNLFSIRPHVKKYLVISDKFYFVLGAGANVGMGSTTKDFGADTPNREEDIFSAGFNVSPGLTYFLNPKWALYSNFGSIFYSYNQSKSSSDDSSEVTQTKKYNDFGASLSWNTFRLGVQYYLRNE